MAQICLKVTSTNLLLVSLMPSPCVSVGAALACASITITSALVLVEILVPHHQLLTVCASFVCDTFKLHQSLAARLDGFNSLCLSWPVLQRLESLCCITGTVRIKRWWLDHRCCLRHDPARTQKLLDVRSQSSSKLRKQQKCGFLPSLLGAIQEQISLSCMRSCSLEHSTSPSRRFEFLRRSSCQWLVAESSSNY